MRYRYNHIGGGAYEARRFMPPQNLGPGGTLWSVPPQNFGRQMLLDPKYIDAFCGIKNKQKPISQRSPDPLPVEKGLAAPLPKNPTPRLGPSDLKLRPFGSCFSVLCFFSPPLLFTFRRHCITRSVRMNARTNAADGQTGNVTPSPTLSSSEDIKTITQICSFAENY